MNSEAETPPPASRLWRALAFSGVLLFVALLAWGLISSAPSTTIDDGLAEGKAPLAPSFELPVLEAGTLPAALRSVGPALADDQLALAELEGTPLLLNFWASWCVPCREEAPLLQRGWRRFGPSGFLFLGLDMQDSTDDAREFIDEFGFTFPTIREPSNEVARSYGATGIPETFFISAQGRVVSHVIGVMSPEQLRDGVHAAKRGEVAGTGSGGDIRPQR